jgi:hypothetical protein
MGYGRHTDHTELNTTKSEVFGVLWHLKKQGYSEYTIKFVRKALNVLEAGCGRARASKKTYAFESILDSCQAYQTRFLLMRLKRENKRIAGEHPERVREGLSSSY